MTRHLKFYLGLLSMFPLKQQKSNFYFNQKQNNKYSKKVHSNHISDYLFLKCLFQRLSKKTNSRLYSSKHIQSVLLSLHLFPLLQKKEPLD